MRRSHQKQKTQNRETSKDEQHNDPKQTKQNKKQATPRGKTKTTQEEPQAPAKTRDHKAGRHSPKRARGKETSGDQQGKERADAGEGSRTGRRRQHKPRRRARAALGVRRVFWITQGRIWKFDTLWERPLGKGEATCHSSWLYSLCTEDTWKATTRVHRVMEDW